MGDGAATLTGGSREKSGRLTEIGRISGWRPKQCIDGTAGAIKTGSIVTDRSFLFLCASDLLCSI
jgi:hypothetical protein